MNLEIRLVAGGISWNFLDGIFSRGLMFPLRGRGILSAAASCRRVTPIATEQDANVRPFVSLATLEGAAVRGALERDARQFVRSLITTFL